jgi:hypothetical protein
MKRKAEDTGVEKRPRDEVVDKVQLLRDLGIAPSNAKGFWTHYPNGEEGSQDRLSSPTHQARDISQTQKR